MLAVLHAQQKSQARRVKDSRVDKDPYKIHILFLLSYLFLPLDYSVYQQKYKLLFLNISKVAGDRHLIIQALQFQKQMIYHLLWYSFKQELTFFAQAIQQVVLIPA